MIKNQLKQQTIHIAKKACFGTKEFSENSGICNRCNYRNSCGKIKKSKRG